MRCRNCDHYDAAPGSDLCNPCQLDQEVLNGLWIAPVIVATAVIIGLFFAAFGIAALLADMLAAIKEVTP